MTDARRASPPPSQSDGRAPPHDERAEREILAAILAEPAALDAVREVGLEPGDLYTVEARTVLEACVAVQDSGGSPTLAAVQSWIADHSELSARVPDGYIQHDLVDGTPYVVEPEAQAERVIGMRRRRQAIATFEEYAARGRFDVPDVQAYLDEAESKVFDLAEAKVNRSQSVSVRLVVEESRAKMRERAMARGLIGHTTGLRHLDELIGGLHPADVTVVAGRPGMGKTCLGMQFLRASAEAGAGAHMFSLEMPRDQLGDRLACAVSHVPVEVVRKPWLLTAAQQRSLEDAFEQVAPLPIDVCDDADITAQSIRGALRRSQARHRQAGRSLGVAVIDYLGLVETVHERGKTREREVAEVTRACKVTAKQLGIHVVLIAQLNRSTEIRKDKRPTLSDLRESGAIEQDADNVLFVYREEYYAPKKESVRNLGEIIVAKQRNGPTGTVKVRFHAPSGRFDTLEHQASTPESEPEPERDWRDSW